MKKGFLHRKNGITIFCMDFLKMCKKAEMPAKLLLKLSVTMFCGLVAAGITIIIFPSMAEPAGVEYITDLVFSSAQKVLLLGVILAAAVDFVLTDKNKNED